MNELGKHVYGPWALVTGAPSGIGDEFAPGGDDRKPRPRTPPVNL
jgi:hypothetical protein